MKKIAILLAMVLFAGLQVMWAQSTITGTVKDTEGAALPGATVRAQGFSGVGTVTDMDGKYSLQIPEGATTLVYSFVGMKENVQTINGRTTIDVTLAPADVTVDEVVVLGYTTKAKNQITGSTVQVKGEDLSEMPVTTVDQALQGKVAGLTISASSGTPGSTQDIRIRGVGSITSSNSPLFVVDGVPIVNDNFSGSTSISSLSGLSSLNSNDIESITVLKDASATSAYGARGSNGVIVITTKKGKRGNKTKFSFSADRGFQNAASEGLKPLTGAQKKELFLDGVYNTYGATYGFTRAEAEDFNTANGLDYGDMTSWDGTEYDWAGELANKNAVVQNYNFSAMGGGETSSFYASMGYNSSEAIVKGSGFDRFSGTLNYSKDISDKVKFEINNTVSSSRQDAFLEQSAYFGNPYLTKYFMSPWENPYNEDGTYNINLNTSVFNTLYTIDNDITKNALTRGLSNSSIKWEIIKNLTFQTRASLDYVLSSYDAYRNRVHGDGDSNGGYSENSVDRNFNIVYQNSLDYKVNFGEHFLAVKGLVEYQKNTDNYVYAYGEKFPTDGLTTVASAGANKDASSTFNDWYNMSYLGMVNYSFQEKYILDLTYRREGSSRFAQGLRMGNFWSTGVAWNIDKESFFSGVKSIFNEFRVRASYGVSGNSGIDLNSYQALLSYDADYADEGAVYPSQFGNTNLTWEKNKTLDAGVDFGLFNNLVTGSFAYYNKETYDLLQLVPLSRTTGHNDQNQNIGTVVNKGIELELNFNIIRTKDFNFNIAANFATVNNEVTKLAKDATGNDINIETGTRKVEVGHPIYEWNMRKWAGVDPDTGMPQWYLNGKDGEVTNDYYAAEKGYVGVSALPTHTAGLSIHADFKGIYFDASMYYAGGHKVFEDWSRYTHHDGVYSSWYYNGVETLMNRWQNPGDVTDVPLMLYSSSANNASRTSTRFLYDGDYARLKDVTLGYSLPSQLLSSVGFSGASIYFKAYNIFTWVKDDRLKYDPEVKADGFTRLTTPPVKSILIGLNLKF